MLKIPDDLENIWINPDPDGHLQAAVKSSDSDEEKVTHSIYHTDLISVKSGAQGVDEKYSWAQIEIRLLEALNHYRDQHRDDAAEIAKSVMDDNNANIAQKTRAEFYFIASGISRKDEPERSRDGHLRLLVEIEDLLETNQLRESDRIEVVKVQSELLNNVGMVITHNLKQYEKALDYFHEAIKINERPEINDQKGIAIANGGLGDCYFYGLKDYGQAENHYTVNLNISRNNGDKQGIVRMTSMLGGIKLLNAKNEQDADIKENLLYEAKEYYNNSLIVAEDQNNIFSIMFALKGLFDCAIVSSAYDSCEGLFQILNKYLESYKNLLDEYPITKIEELQKRQDNKEELKENERAALNDYNTLSKALLILSKKPPKFIEDLKMFETIQEKTKGQFKKEIENYYNIINQPES